MPRSVRCAVQALALCVGYFCLVTPSAYAQSLKEQLVGTWTLVSMTRVIDDTEQPGLLGRDPVGQFMFGPDGRMCFNATRRDRPKFDSPYPGGTSEEKAAAYDSYVGYCGRYEVNEEERSILFRLDLGTYPNWTSRARACESTHLPCLQVARRSLARSYGSGRNETSTMRSVR
jgi:hypothetical protein